MIGTDADVDRRLSAVAEVDIPFYRGLQIGVPSLPAIVEALAEGRYDLVHLCSPGPAGIGGMAAGAGARAAARRQLPHRARRVRRAADRARPARGAGRDGARRVLRRPCDVVLSPSPATDERLAELGIARDRIGRWDRGVDLERFDPALRDAGAVPRRGQRPVRGPADQGEGRRPARRRVPGGARGATRACTSCSPAAAPRRTRCASGSATPPPSSGGSTATSSRAPTRAPTRSCSPARPTRSAR